MTPSLICMDIFNLERDIRKLETLGVDFLHIDILDGHFSPSLPLGLELVKQLRKRTDLAFDVHLMVENNEFFILEMAKIGVQQLCFHFESAFHVDRMLSLTQEAGIIPAKALSPQLVGHPQHA